MSGVENPVATWSSPSHVSAEQGSSVINNFSCSPTDLVNGHEEWDAGRDLETAARDLLEKQGTNYRATFSALENGVTKEDQSLGQSREIF